MNFSQFDLKATFDSEFYSFRNKLCARMIQLNSFKRFLPCINHCEFNLINYY